MRMDCSEALKWSVVGQVAGSYRDEYPVLEVDGARVQLPEGWALIRASNTADELVMRWEGKTPEARDRIGEELVARVKAHL